MTKPWLTDQGHIDDLEDPSVDGTPPLKMFVWLFMAVVTILFTLLFAAYHMRREYADWIPLAEPSLLWINSGLLIMASVALQWAWNAASSKDANGLKLGLIAGGIFTFAFVIGQLVAWQQLAELGYFASANPSYAFFYVITGLHALHILGGLVAWAVTAGKVWNGVEIDQVEMNVELCAEYWHFLLLVWIVMFGLLLTT
jgi:cytochrome c oxidase subunit 3